MPFPIVQLAFITSVQDELDDLIDVTNPNSSMPAVENLRLQLQNALLVVDRQTHYNPTKMHIAAYYVKCKSCHGGASSVRRERNHLFE
jgi:hypothetical protein